MTASEHLNSQQFSDHAPEEDTETGFSPFSSYFDEDYDDGVSYRPFSSGHPEND